MQHQENIILSESEGEGETNIVETMWASMLVDPNELENIYDIVLVLNYNVNPIIKNKGSAIFIHVAKKNYKKTEGCVALKKVHLIKVLKELKNNTSVKIVDQK